MTDRGGDRGKLLVPFREVVVKERRGREQYLSIDFGFRPVRLPDFPDRQLWLVVAKGFGREPMMLLTSRPLRRSHKDLRNPRLPLLRPCQRPLEHPLGFQAPKLGFARGRHLHHPCKWPSKASDSRGSPDRYSDGFDLCSGKVELTSTTFDAFPDLGEIKRNGVKAPAPLLRRSNSEVVVW